MVPFELRTARLVLDQPAEGDLDAIVRYCQDPLFERFLTIPWPYGRRDAEYFVRQFVPGGWASDREYTWAIRRKNDPLLLGVVGFRTARPDLGYWLGEPHRGHGYTTEAVRAVVDWALANGHDRVHWECVAGNAASAAVARKSGFSFTGEGPSTAPFRDGVHRHSWHGVLSSGTQDTRPWPSP